MLVHLTQLDTRSLSEEQLVLLEQELDARSEGYGILLENGVLTRNLNDEQFETVRRYARDWHTQLITHAVLRDIPERPLFQITYDITAPVYATTTVFADDLRELELLAERQYETADMEIGNVDNHTTTWEPLNEAARNLLRQVHTPESPSADPQGQGAVTRHTFEITVRGRISVLAGDLSAARTLVRDTMGKLSCKDPRVPELDLRLDDCREA